MISLEQLRAEALREHIPVMRPETAALLAREVERIKPEASLEIGTCIGLGVINILLHGGKKVTSIEIDEDRFFAAKKNLCEFGLESRCELILGDCKEIIPLMSGNKYDLIVLDGPKSYYPEVYPYLKEMLKEGGVLFADDILFHGMIDGDGLPAHKHRTNVNALRRFIEMTENDPDMDVKKYDIEDGVLLLTKRG